MAYNYKRTREPLPQHTYSISHPLFLVEIVESKNPPTCWFSNCDRILAFRHDGYEELPIILRHNRVVVIDIGAVDEEWRYRIVKSAKDEAEAADSMISLARRREKLKQQKATTAFDCADPFVPNSA